MTSPRIRAQYDALERIAAAFDQQAEALRTMNRNLRNRMQSLQGGDWMGRGAQAFYREMGDDVMPAVDRLVSAMQQASSVTRRMSGIIQDAEHEAARYLSAEPGAAQGLASAAVGSDGSNVLGEGGLSQAAGWAGGSTFPEFAALSPKRQRLLENSLQGTVEIRTGGQHFKYEGVDSPEEFYAMMQRQHPRELANFLNQTAVLESVKFEDGTTALDYVSRVTEFRQDRILVDLQKLSVASGGSEVDLKSQLDRVSAPSEGEARFIGPHDTPAHGDYSVTYRESAPIGAQQISFDPKHGHARADIDIDYYNPEAGKGLEHALLEVLPNTVIGTRTDPFRVYEILQQRDDIEIDYELGQR